MVNVTVWNENFHETFGEFNNVSDLSKERIAKLSQSKLDTLKRHPKGIHNTIADIINELGDDVNVRTATLQQEECGLTTELLDNTDVLIWWGHCVHNEVPDEIVSRIQDRILKGMGLIALHSSHYSKIFKKMLGTSCDLRYKDDVYERIFCINPSHPIAKGIPENFELGIEECYGERFDIPTPDELVFLGWFDIGEVFRSGCTWKRGYGKIFYFQPGHETNTAFENKYVRKILQNAVYWAKTDAYRENLGCTHIFETLEDKRIKI